MWMLHLSSEDSQVTTGNIWKRSRGAHETTLKSKLIKFQWHEGFSCNWLLPVIFLITSRTWTPQASFHLQLVAQISALRPQTLYFLPAVNELLQIISSLGTHSGGDSGVAGVCATSFRKSRYPACFLTPHRKHIHPHAVCSLAVAKGFPRLSLHQTAASWRR